MRAPALVMTVLSASLLVACGGDGGEEPPPPQAQVSLKGVAARGAALAGATVIAKCAGGTGSTVTASDGTYTLAITGGTLPCVLSATSGAVVLHSVATGAGDTATANITPLTELLVAQLSGSAPAAFFATAGTETWSSLTATRVNTAEAAVLATLTGAGIDTTALGGIVTGTLVAASGSTGGNGHDQVLDALNASLGRAGSTLSELATTVASAAAAGSGRGGSDGGSGGAASAATPSLPAGLLLKPKAANCDALRSGNYNIVVLRSAAAGDPVIASGSVDAATLTWRFSDGEVSNWTAVGDCGFTSSGTTGTTDDMKVTRSGVIVARVYDAGSATYRLALGLPAQTVPVSELAGDWQVMGWERGGNSVGAYAIAAGRARVDASGQVSAADCFDDALAPTVTTCTAVTGALPVFRAQAAGALTLVGVDSASNPWTDRVFAFRSGGGDLGMAVVSEDGASLSLWSRRPATPASLPSVGAISSTWGFTVGTNGVVAGPIGFTTNTVTSVDAVAGSYTRDGTSNGGSVATPQTVRINTPREGISYRVPGSTTDSSGKPATVREFFAMSLRAMDLSTVYLPASGNAPAQFNVSAYRKP
jgi:hypothetical protein